MQKYGAKCNYCNRIDSQRHSWMAIDGRNIINSDHALMLEELPLSIIIVGGGVIGIEWASMLADFGVQVSVVEAAKQILPAEDWEGSCSR